MPVSREFIVSHIHAHRITLAAVPTASSSARAFVRHTLGSWNLDGLTDNASLVVSELVTNAVKATDTSPAGPTFVDLRDLALVYVELKVDDDVLRIAVADGSREQPVLQAVDDEAEGGRGLFLVQMLSARWGVCPTPGGKVTRAELPLGKRDAVLSGDCR